MLASTRSCTIQVCKEKGPFEIIIFYLYLFIYLFIYLLWDWGLNSGFRICKAGAVPLEPQLQSISVWLLWRWCISNYLPGLAWPETEILWILTSQVARITDVATEL
jgi:hypothetical protein